MTQQSSNTVSTATLPHNSNGPGMLQRAWWVLEDSYVLMQRNLMHFVREPQLLIFATIQPVIFLLLFVYVFGGAIRFAIGGDYINYLVPGIIIQAIIFSASNTTVGLSVDLSRGMIDRFRSLPTSRAAVLAGRTTADTARGTLTIIFMLFTGMVIGFRFEDWSSGIAGFLLAVAFGHSFTWMSATLGLYLKDPETAQVAGYVWVLPLTFASSIFVPTVTMPDWLRPFAENQPVSVVANTVRDLMTGAVNPDEIALSLLWIIGIFLVFMPLSVWKYAKVASR